MKSRLKSFIKNSKPASEDSGQAAIEYILLIVIATAVIFGGIRNFSTSFETYLNSYFGDYLSCLLETGELPALGAPNGVNRSVCNAEFEEFSFVDGRPPKANQSSSNSSNGGSSPNAGSSDDSGDRGGGSGPRVRSGAGSGSRGGTADGGSSTSGSGFRANSGGSKKKSSGSSDSFSAGATLGADNRKVSGPKNGSSSSKKQKKVKERFARYTPNSSKKNKSRVRAKTTGGFKDNPDGKKSSFAYKAPERKIASDPKVEFGFGGLVRYLIIFAIIIVLVVVIGGQVLSASKELD